MGLDHIHSWSYDSMKILQKWWYSARNAIFYFYFCHLRPTVILHQYINHNLFLFFLNIGKLCECGWLKHYNYCYFLFSAFWYHTVIIPVGHEH